MRCGVFAIIVSACGSDPPARADADAGADAGPDDFVPTPPASPAPPRLECPKGWRAIVDAEDPATTTCDPWPASGRAVCPTGEAHFPGGAGCERIGAPCPADDFADGLPASGVVYVLAGAVGGDGTRASPFGRIADALAAAPDGAIVALSKGDFDEVVGIDRAVTIRGACVAETAIGSSVPDRSATVILEAAVAVEMRDLRITGERWGIDVQPDSGPLTLNAITVEGAVDVAIVVQAGATLVADGLTVRGTRPTDTGEFGTGLQAELGATALVDRASFEHNRVASIAVFDPDTVVDLRDVSIADTAGEPATGIGTGLSVLFGSTASLTRGVVEESTSAGIQVVGAGSSLVAQDLVVRETRPNGNGGEAGRGIEVAGGATCRVTGALFEHNRAESLLSRDPGSLLDLADVVVRDTDVDLATGELGLGLEVLLGASAEVSRASFLRNRAAGIGVFLGGTSLSATDVSIDGTEANDAGEFGLGLAIGSGSSAFVSRLALRANRVAGIGVAGIGAEIDGSDVTIADMRERASDHEAGEGIALRDGGRATLTRMTVGASLASGVVAEGTGSSGVFEELLVSGTRPQTCSTDGCDGHGSGLVAVGGSTIVARRFRIDGSALCGIQLARDGAIDLSDGDVVGNRIGANVQSEGFDVSRLQAGVRWIDNDVTLDAAVLPVPTAPGIPSP